MNNLNRIEKSILLARGKSQFIGYQRIYVDLTGDIKAAVLFNQCVFWSDKSKRCDGYFYKTDDEFMVETGLSKAEIKRVKRILKSLGFIKTKLERANGAPTTHYFVDIPFIQQAINQYSKIHQLDKSETIHSDLVKSDQSITENTTESTSQNTTVSEPGSFTTPTCIMEDSIKEATDSKHIEGSNSYDEDDIHKEDISWLMDDVLKVCGVSSLSIEEKERIMKIGRLIFHEYYRSYYKFSKEYSWSPEKYEKQYIQDKLKWAEGIWFKEGRRLSPTQILNAIEKPVNKEKWRRYNQNNGGNTNKIRTGHQHRQHETDSKNLVEGVVHKLMPISSSKVTTYAEIIDRKYQLKQVIK